MSRRAIQNVDVAVISPYDSALKPISSEESQKLRSGHKRGSSLAIRQKPIAWQEGYNSGQAEGFAKGFESGRTEAIDAERIRYESEANAFADRLSQFAVTVENELPHFLEKLESELAALATIIAERIISQELKLGRDSVVSIAKDALKEALPTNGVTIRVNPFDAQIIESRIEELVRASQGIKAIEISSDPTIRGGCLIETEGGAIDARIEMMLGKVVEASRSAA